MRRATKRINYLTRYYRAAKCSTADTHNDAYSRLNDYVQALAYRICIQNKLDRPEYIRQSESNLLQATMLMLLERAYENNDDLLPLTQTEYYYNYIKNTGTNKLYAELDALPPSNLAFVPFNTITYPDDKEQQRAVYYELLLSDLQDVLSPAKEQAK